MSFWAIKIHSPRYYLGIARFALRRRVQACARSSVSYTVHGTSLPGHVPGALPTLTAYHSEYSCGSSRALRIETSYSSRSANGSARHRLRLYAEQTSGVSSTARGAQGSSGGATQYHCHRLDPNFGSASAGPSADGRVSPRVLRSRWAWASLLLRSLSLPRGPSGPPGRLAADATAPTKRLKTKENHLVLMIWC